VLERTLPAEVITPLYSAKVRHIWAAGIFSKRKTEVSTAKVQENDGETGASFVGRKAESWERSARRREGSEES